MTQIAIRLYIHQFVHGFNRKLVKEYLLFENRTQTIVALRETAADMLAFISIVTATSCRANSHFRGYLSQKLIAPARGKFARSLVSIWMFENWLTWNWKSDSASKVDVMWWCNRYIVTVYCRKRTQLLLLHTACFKFHLQIIREFRG